MTAIAMNTLKDITTIVWDVDQTLYPYWGRVAESFSFFTASTAKPCINVDPKPSLDYLTDLAKQSYQEHGLTTRLIAQKYRIDEIKLYRDHHTTMMRDLIKVQWNDNVEFDKGLVDVFQKTSERDIRNIAFTHGTTEWGREIVNLRGLADYTESMYGIDEFGLRLKSKHVSLWKAFLKAAKIKKNADGDYSHVLVVEDTPANLIIPKREFNMQTGLIKTERYTAQTSDIIDAVYSSATHVGRSILTCS